jgi:uncharacterized protein (DUF305 family)
MAALVLGTVIGSTATGGTAHASPLSRSVTMSADTSQQRYVPADVRFVQRMMGHHAQALEMTALVPARSSRTDLRMLAQRITISQRDEISLMRQWLEKRHAALPSLDRHAVPHDTSGHDTSGHGTGGHDMAGHAMAGHDMAGHEAMMPGMLSPAELTRLAEAKGVAFDRLFLEGMIRHHEGALAMVSELLATHGAGQEPELFRLVSDIDADQRAEIRRMRSMLGAPPSQAHHH